MLFGWCWSIGGSTVLSGRRSVRSRRSLGARRRRCVCGGGYRGEHRSEWAAICSIAEKFGCSSETLRLWVRRAERDQGVRPGLTTSEREVRELRRANEILRKASAYFAQAELDRRPRK